MAVEGMVLVVTEVVMVETALAIVALVLATQTVRVTQTAAVVAVVATQVRQVPAHHRARTIRGHRAGATMATLRRQQLYQHRLL